MTRRRHILIITAYYPPMQDVAGIRNAGFARYLPEFGWEPSILTISPDGHEHREGNVWRIPLQRYYRLSQTSVAAPETARLDWHKRFFASGVGIVKKAFASFFVPDTLRFWCTTRLRKAAETMIREHSIDTILVSCAPFSLPLTVLPLRKKLGIRVVLDFRDGLTQNPYPIYPAAQEATMRQYEQSILRQADRLITTTPLTTKAYEERYPFLRGKIATITNGFDDDAFSGIDFSQKEEQFTLVYSGVIDEHRSIDAIIRAFTDLHLPQSQFLILGKILQPATLELLRTSSNVHFLGYRPRTQSLQKTTGAHLLVLHQGFRMKTALCYPIAAKTFEYLRMGNPILCYAPQGDNCAIIEKYCAQPYLVTREDAGSIRTAIRDCYDKWRKNALSFTPNQDFLARYNRRELTRQLAALLNSIVP